MTHLWIQNSIWSKQWIWRFWRKHSCKFWGSHSSLSEDLGLLEYEALSLGDWLPVFGRNDTASYSRWLNPLWIWIWICILILMKIYDFLLVKCAVIIWLSSRVLMCLCFYFIGNLAVLATPSLIWYEGFCWLCTAIYIDVCFKQFHSNK